MFSEGKVALMLTYLGEELGVAVEKTTGPDGTSSSHTIMEPCVSCDLWRAVQHLHAHKLPSSPYLSGLTFLDRRVLQCLIDVEKEGGSAATSSLTILLAVDSLHTSWVADEVMARRHWGLQPHQIIIVSIAR